MERREALAWAAGFIDGEGCFFLQGNREYPGFTISQTEEHSIRRLHELFGIGNVNTYKKPRYKRVWTLQVHGFENVQYVAALIWPWSTVKRDQMRRVLLKARARPPKPKRQDTCKVAGCTKKCKYATYCTEHKEERNLARGKQCKVDGCPRGTVAKDMCQKHYSASFHEGGRGASGNRTECPKGHPYDEANTYIDPRGHRVCRICQREAKRAWEQRQREARSGSKPAAKATAHTKRKSKPKKRVTSTTRKGSSRRTT